jgi:hypothetical protein
MSHVLITDARVRYRSINAYAITVLSKLGCCHHYVQCPFNKESLANHLVY